jgi:hypothetical protein
VFHFGSKRSLALPEDKRDQVSVDMIADMAAVAFSGRFPALA